MPDASPGYTHAGSGTQRPDRCNVLAREALSEHGQSALGFRPRALILDDVPVLDENSVDHAKHRLIPESRIAER